MKFTFAVESINLADRLIKIVYTPDNSSIAPFHFMLFADLEVLSLPVEEAKEVLRKDIVRHAPMDYWQSQIDSQQLEVPSELLEVIGEDFEVTDEEHQSVISESVTNPITYVENLTPIEQAYARVATTRYTVEKQGVTWIDAENVSWFLDTSIESQNRFASARLAVEAGTRSEGGVWKCATLDEFGTPTIMFRSTTNAEIIEWSELCHAHVQKCFEAEALAVAAIDSGDTDTNVFMREFTAL